MQVQMLNDRKAEKGGHSADAVADALFGVELGIRLKRRGESQTESVAKLLANILHEKEEEALKSCIITADRGYGKNYFLIILHQEGSVLLWSYRSNPLAVFPSFPSHTLTPIGAIGRRSVII